MYYKFEGRESWWELFDYIDDNGNFNILNEFSKDESFRFNLFKFHNNNQIPKDRLFTDNDIVEFCKIYDPYLDINADGVANSLDIKLLWYFFTSTLTSDSYSNLITPKTLTSIRNNFNKICDYLSDNCGTNERGEILNSFYNDFLNDTEANVATKTQITPYITTIGLYDGADLIAVAKLGTPIKNQGIFPLNFIVRFDI